MKLFTALSLLRKKFFSSKESEYASYVLADKLCGLIYPKYRFSEYSRSWLDDEEFFRCFSLLHGPGDQHSADRKFFLKNLVKLAVGLEGDTAECGVYHGASSYLICECFQGQGKTHHLFDSFAGLSEPTDIDGTHWHARQFASDEGTARNNLAEFEMVTSHRGWIPDRFRDVDGKRFCFVHVDVDLYQPTFDSMQFFYPRTVPGGIILVDDYGFRVCPGAKTAVDEVMKDKPEPVIEIPSGQAFVLKK